ncbi:type II toxin-antitoxin system YafQ family toxin [Acinetobacter pittii]|uniref:type II toxin-antitoxin system YafQ family toxin n=1 Tax=Acinetobacter pittii TaxID=48296 RepID=UPI001D17D8AA|nr:type II toxin-antitoxin system YafQ family toxin [Acinetobacter pittii]
MRTIKYTSAFKKDYKREKKGQHRNTLDAELQTVLELLQADEALPEKYRDHALVSNWVGHRDCHMALLHKDLKCKAPLIEPNLRRNLGKWST